MHGVTLTTLRIIPGQKGVVMHGLKASEATFYGFGEAYLSSVTFGEIKGWKRHRRMVLNLVVAVGTIRFVLHDDRAGSPTRGTFAEYTLGAARTYARLTVEPGIWFAFKGEDPGLNLVLNVASIEHDPREVDQRAMEGIAYVWT